MNNATQSILGLTFTVSALAACGAQSDVLTSTHQGQMQQANGTWTVWCAETDTSDPDSAMTTFMAEAKQGSALATLVLRGNQPLAREQRATTPAELSLRSAVAGRQMSCNEFASVPRGCTGITADTNVAPVSSCADLPATIDHQYAVPCTSSFACVRTGTSTFVDVSVVAPSSYESVYFCADGKVWFAGAALAAEVY